jgi:hypothetical protein
MIDENRKNVESVDRGLMRATNYGGTEKTHEKHRRFAARDFKWGLPENEADAVATRRRASSAISLCFGFVRCSEQKRVSC